MIVATGDDGSVVALSPEPARCAGCGVAVHLVVSRGGRTLCPTCDAEAGQTMEITEAGRSALAASEETR